MKKEEFVEKLCDHMEGRVVEICKKFATGNVNNTSLYAFWIGLSTDIQSFIKDNKLKIVKRYDNKKNKKNFPIFHLTLNYQINSSTPIIS